MSVGGRFSRATTGFAAPLTGLSSLCESKRMAVSRSWGYVSFASFAVLCEHCANVSLFLERIPFALSSQRTARLAKKLRRAHAVVLGKLGCCYTSAAGRNHFGIHPPITNAAGNHRIQSRSNNRSQQCRASFKTFLRHDTRPPGNTQTRKPALSSFESRRVVSLWRRRTSSLS